MRSLACFAFLIIWLLPCRAQEDEYDGSDFQLWLDLVQWFPQNNKLRLGGDFGFRGFVTNDDWNQVYVRPALQYFFNKNLVGATGISWWRTNNKGLGNVNELRFHQDMEVVNWPKLGFIQPYFRLRFEERFFFYESSANDWYARVRLMPGLQTNDIVIGKQKFFFIFLWEGFKPFINNSSPEPFIERTRSKVIFGHQFAKQWRYEMHFLLQRSRVLSEDGFELDSKILRIRFFHILPWPS